MGEKKYFATVNNTGSSFAYRSNNSKMSKMGKIKRSNRHISKPLKDLAATERSKFSLNRVNNEYSFNRNKSYYEKMMASTDRNRLTGDIFGKYRPGGGGETTRE